MVSLALAELSSKHIATTSTNCVSITGFDNTFYAPPKEVAPAQDRDGEKEWHSLESRVVQMAILINDRGPICWLDYRCKAWARCRCLYYRRAHDKKIGCSGSVDEQRENFLVGLYKGQLDVPIVGWSHEVVRSKALTCGDI